MNAVSKKHFDRLSQETKDELYGLVDMIEGQDYEKAMVAVQASQKPIPEGYVFSHYIVQGVGNQQNTRNPIDAIEAINERLNGHRLEVTALLKTRQHRFPDDRECLERSILYVNFAKGAQFLDGKAISGKIDPNKLVDLIRSYQK